MFPAVLQATASSTPASSHTQTTAATGATQKRVRERGGGWNHQGTSVLSVGTKKLANPPLHSFISLFSLPHPTPPPLLIGSKNGKKKLDVQI